MAIFLRKWKVFLAVKIIVRSGHRRERYSLGEMPEVLKKESERERERDRLSLIFVLKT